MTVVGTDDQSSSNPESPTSPASLRPAVVAEPITVFHYEVLTVGDPKVAMLTTHLLYTSSCLFIIAIVNFVFDLNTSDLSLSSAIVNLVVSLSLPACGIVGVKDKNVTCIQYFCCCTYFCAFLTFGTLISTIVVVANGSAKYWPQLVLSALFFAVYAKGGGLSQRLQEQPYFTQARLAPQQGFNVHQNTVEFQPQPTAHAEFVTIPPSDEGQSPLGSPLDQAASGGGGAGGGPPSSPAPHSVIVVEASPVDGPIGGGGERGGVGGGQDGPPVVAAAVVAVAEEAHGGGSWGGGGGSGGEGGGGDGPLPVAAVPVAAAVAVEIR